MYSSLSCHRDRMLGKEQLQEEGRFDTQFDRVVCPGGEGVVLRAVPSRSGKNVRCLLMMVRK